MLKCTNLRGGRSLNETLASDPEGGGKKDILIAGDRSRQKKNNREEPKNPSGKFSGEILRLKEKKDSHFC